MNSKCQTVCRKHIYKNRDHNKKYGGKERRYVKIENKKKVDLKFKKKTQQQTIAKENRENRIQIHNVNTYVNKMCLKKNVFF